MTPLSTHPWGRQTVLVIRLKWQPIWKAILALLFNGVKHSCCLIKLLSINRFRTSFLPSVQLKASEFTESTQIRLLGLTFTNNFSWKPYIESIAKSAAMMVGSLFRVLHFLSPESVRYIYQATIQPYISILLPSLGWSLCCMSTSF